MSTVVGIINDGKVFMGADSYASTLSGDIRRIKCPKIFLNRGYLIGFVGSIRSGQLLRPGFFKPPDQVLEFPERILKQFKNGLCLAFDPDTQAAVQESNFLIATSDGRLFEILTDFQMNEIIDYTAIGSGANFALGSLYTTKNRKDPKKRVLTALKAATTYDLATGGPFLFKEFLE